MKNPNERTRRLEGALGRAYRERPVPSPGPTWTQDTMRRIRQEADVRAPSSLAAETFVWRFAWGATACAALVLTGGWLAGLQPETALAWLWMNDPTGLSFGIFGL